MNYIDYGFFKNRFQKTVEIVKEVLEKNNFQGEELQVQDLSSENRKFYEYEGPFKGKSYGVIVDIRRQKGGTLLRLSFPSRLFAQPGNEDYENEFIMIDLFKDLCRKLDLVLGWKTLETASYNFEKTFKEWIKQKKINKIYEYELYPSKEKIKEKNEEVILEIDESVLHFNKNNIEGNIKEPKRKGIKIKEINLDKLTPQFCPSFIILGKNLVKNDTRKLKKLAERALFSTEAGENLLIYLYPLSPSSRSSKKFRHSLDYNAGEIFQEIISTINKN